MTKSKGFTLIELLIVVSIIGILAAIALFSYQTFLKNARNAKRQADLKLIQSALEQYHADQKYYPFEIKPGESLKFGSKIYLNIVPNDPIGSPDYDYQSLGSGCADTAPQNCTSYCLFTQFEGTPPKSDSGCTPSGSFKYGVSRP